MEGFTTISVKKSVKRMLEKGKKDKDWSEFLYDFYSERARNSESKAFTELRKVLTDSDVKNIEKSYKNFRKGFELR